MDNKFNYKEELTFDHAGNVLRQFRRIETFIFDVDGVLTNGELLITEKGELLRKMNVKDGYALKKTLNEGFRVIIITGGNSKGTIDRLGALGIEDIISGAHNKLKYYERLVDLYQLDEERILYMGDDIPDLEVMRRVGFPCCPSDAVPEIIQASTYVSPFGGGKGCVRDVLEKVLKLKKKWV